MHLSHLAASKLRLFAQPPLLAHRCSTSPTAWVWWRLFEYPHTWMPHPCVQHSSSTAGLHVSASGRDPPLALSSLVLWAYLVVLGVWQRLVVPKRHRGPFCLAGLHRVQCTPSWAVGRPCGTHYRGPGLLHACAACFSLHRVRHDVMAAARVSGEPRHMPCKWRRSGTCLACGVLALSQPAPCVRYAVRRVDAFNSPGGLWCMAGMQWPWKGNPLPKPFPNTARAVLCEGHVASVCTHTWWASMHRGLLAC